jgi:hypothetical protein
MLILLLAGCGFKGGRPGDGDGSMNGSDGGAGDDLAMCVGCDDGGGGGNPDFSGGGGDGGIGGCALPELFVLVNSSNGATSMAGRVLQYTIHSDGTTTKCGNDLTANGTLNSQVSTIGWIAPHVIGGDATGNLFALDPVADSYRWTYQPPCCAGDGPVCNLFPIKRSDGKTQIGMGWGCAGTGSPDLTGIDVFDNANGKKIEGWKFNDAASPILLGLSVLAMTTSPFDPTHIFYATENGATNPGAAMDIPLPVDGGMVQATQYQGPLPTGLDWVIRAIPSSNGGGRRTAWVAHGFSPAQDELYFVNDTGGGPQLTGPLHCNNLGTGTGMVNCATPQVFNDVMPDPSNATKLFATCESNGSNGMPNASTGLVVRIDSANTCELIVDGSKLPLQSYPATFALAQ